jgi:hypothetical protein
MPSNVPSLCCWTRPGSWLVTPVYSVPFRALAMM